jgi:trimethylamine--corrinoid protein Co-methyltransferase
LRPSIRFLTTESIEKIHKASLNVLENTGISVNNVIALDFLEKAGCNIASSIARFPPHIVENALETVPSDFRLYSRDGDKAYLVGKDNVIFNPGSSSLNIIDSDNGIIRKALTKDLVHLALLVDAVGFIYAQSTALVPSDVPNSISDSYRLYIILKNSNKPIITGAFSKESILDMIQMLGVVTGGGVKLGEEPRAIFDCCPTSPLTWSDITCQNLIDCARNNIPAEIVPAPQISATSPTTLTGTLIQVNAEILSGIVISQLIKEGAPIVFGSAPISFDMKFCTGRTGAIEAMMTACATSELGKYYGIPTHAYLGISDSNVIDAQSGFETAFGIMLALLAHINIVSGPGMLSSLNSQSLEKIIIDDEICGAAYRLLQGVGEEGFSSDIDVISNVGPGGHFIGEKHTRDYLEEVHFFPSSVISRLTSDTWQRNGSKNILERAKERVKEILKQHSGTPLQFDTDNKLDEIFIDIMNNHGIAQRQLPWGL